MPHPERKPPQAAQVGDAVGPRYRPLEDVARRRTRVEPRSTPPVPAWTERRLLYPEVPLSLAALPKEDRLYRMRHSAAHIMAEAVLEMFPEARFAIGPPIDNGFYYDFELSRPLTPDD